MNHYSYTKEEIEEKFNKLPGDLKEALQSEKVITKIYEIVEEFSFPEETMEKLLDICTDIFLGILPLKNVSENMRKELNLSSEKAEEIFKNLNSEIFDKYKESLERISQEDLEIKQEEIEKKITETIEEKEGENLDEKIKKESLEGEDFDKYREPLE